MTYTLLELVQLILSAMDSDDVDSITDTTESNQVALLLKGVYYDLASELDLPYHQTLFQLDETSSSTPILMTVPSNVIDIEWVEYDNKETGDESSNYVRVPFIELQDFVKQTNMLGGTTLASNIAEVNISMNSEIFPILHETDRFPYYYTTADDYNLIFNAYDSTEDTYLVATKTRCFGTLYPSFTLSDSFTPDLNPQQFSLYINRAKVRAFAELKQVSNVEAASETRSQKIRLQRNKRISEDLKEIYKVPRYGRR